MRVIVRGKNKFEPSDSIRDYASKNLEKLSHFFQREELEANVLCKSYDAYKAVEITIPTKNIILRAEVKDKTVYGAIDKAIDTIESQIKKHKSKIYKSLKKREGLGEYYASQVQLDLDEFEEDGNQANIVRTKSVALKPMSVQDAVAQMEMLGHDFFLFLNEDNDKVSVVYVRDDKDYGLIESK